MAVRLWNAMIDGIEKHIGNKFAKYIRNKYAPETPAKDGMNFIEAIKQAKKGEKIRRTFYSPSSSSLYVSKNGYLLFENNEMYWPHFEDITADDWKCAPVSLMSFERARKKMFEGATITRQNSENIYRVDNVGRCTMNEGEDAVFTLEDFDAKDWMELLG